VVRLSAAKASRQLASDKVRNGARAQVGLVAHGVQLHVGLDVLGELDGVAWLAGEGEERVLVEGARLVISGLEDRDATHGGFGGGDEGEVSAGET